MVVFPSKTPLFICYKFCHNAIYLISGVDIAIAAGEKDKRDAAVFSSKHCLATPCALALARVPTNIAVRGGSSLGANVDGPVA